MKSILPTFIFVLTGAALLHAQPTIQLIDATPALGSTVEVVSASYVNPGGAGANQTWDLSAMDADDTSTITYLSPAGQPMAENFPQATHCLDVSTDGVPYYQYWSYADNKAEELGAYGEGPGLVIDQFYINPRARVQFPLQFNETFSDGFENETITIVIIGEDEYTSLNNETGAYAAEVDGYGTLTTPAGTFEDVLRIKYTTAFNQESYSDGELTFEAEVGETEYVFIQAAIPFPLATLTERNMIVDGVEMDPQFFASYYSGGTVGIAESDNWFGETSLFPVPANELVNVHLMLDEPMEIGFALFAANGRKIRDWNSQWLVAGENQLQFNLPDLPVGNYLLRVSNSQHQIVRMLTVGK